MRVLATMALSFAAGLFLVLVLPWSGWYLWAAAGVCLLALTLCFGFLTIRLEDSTVLDFLIHAVRFFLSTQQYFEWK